MTQTLPVRPLHSAQRTGPHRMGRANQNQKPAVKGPTSRKVREKWGSRMVPCGGGHYQFVVLGYVFMPEHVHLLISEPEKGNPSVVIQALKLGFVRQLFPTSRKKQMGQPKIIRKSSSAALLAKALLRFQCVERVQTHRETTRHPPQPSQARIGRYSRSREMEQFPSLCLRRNWACGCE